MKYLLALDEGTTSARAVVFDKTGTVLGLGRRSLSLYYPEPGWVEQDALEIWELQLEAMREAVVAAGISPGDIAAVGIANQRETTVMWDASTGKPVCRAVVWQDRRTAEFCDRLTRDGHRPLIRAKTGLVVDAYFSASKIRWILDRAPESSELLKAGKLRFGTIDTWLLWKLTGVHATDVSNASRTMLFNIHALRWDDELLRLFGVAREILPDVRPSAYAFGHTKVLGPPLPLTGVAGDQQAAAFGQACFRPGMAKNTYGTGCFILMNTGARAVESRSGLLTTVAWQVGGETVYALEGAVFNAGASVEWLKTLFSLDDPVQIVQMAASVPSSQGVYFVPAFTGLGAPHWDPDARALIIGLTRGVGAAHIARAAVDAMVYQSDEVLRAMVHDAQTPVRALRVDGGASEDDRLMQLQADYSGVEIHRPLCAESTALGAAFLAGLGAGVYRDTAEIESFWRAKNVFVPRAGTDAETDKRYWDKAVKRAMQWVER
ncbi:MAG: glycerol kinase GlpK [Bacteroidia bacterium]|nr:glycerol kinase GlpK [Bacteroidia bacterium]